jgi:hypothetical protein
MAKTSVADIIIPTEFEKYAIERTAELSAFGECGIVESAPEFDALAAGGGREVKMPFWKDLSAARQILNDAGSLAVNKITSDQDIARIHNDAQVWSVNHLAKVISGDDPMQAIVDLVSGYWARIDEGLIVSCLKGMFGAASMAGNLLSIKSETIAGQSAATRLNGATFVDATQKLGDRGDRLTASPAVSRLVFIDHDADDRKLPALCDTPLGRHSRAHSCSFAISFAIASFLTNACRLSGSARPRLLFSPVFAISALVRWQRITQWRSER